MYYTSSLKGGSGPEPHENAQQKEQGEYQVLRISTHASQISREQWKELGGNDTDNIGLDDCLLEKREELTDWSGYRDQEN